MARDVVSLRDRVLCVLPNGQRRKALVTMVKQSEVYPRGGWIDVTVELGPMDPAGEATQTSINYDPKGARPCSWCWPEDVGAP